jgi:integrase
MKKLPTQSNFKLAEDYAEAATADNTKLAYKKDLERFIDWGGKLPSSTAQICAYLSEHATTHKPSTLSRWIASISQAHQIAGHETPTHSIDVRRTLAGIKRESGSKQRRVAPIMTEELMAMVDKMPDTLTGRRDKAILLLGFGGAMRRSEITRLKIEDFQSDTRGAIVDLGKTKTDQDGEDSKVAIPKAKNPKYCPIIALKSWLSVSGITDGQVFRAINKHGAISKTGMSTQSIADIVKKLALSAGLDPSTFSGHSMRAGLATSAAKAGKPTHKIRAITRHKSDAMLSRYIRDGEQFENNAADLL